jgi:hypothetical protein
MENQQREQNMNEPGKSSLNHEGARHCQSLLIHPAGEFFRHVK